MRDEWLAGDLEHYLRHLLGQRAQSRRKPAGAQRLEAAQAEIFHVIQVLDHVAVLLLGLVVLFLEDRRGAARITRKEKQQIVFKIVERLGVDLERPGFDAVIFVEAEARQAAERR